MYCAVVWQHVIGMVCVLCGGVAACHRYGVCTVRWGGTTLPNHLITYNDDLFTES